MVAARSHRADLPLPVDDVPMPGPGPDEVRVRVRAAGVGGTESHCTEGLHAPSTVPMTLGNEVAGTVVAVGGDVTGWSVGARATLPLAEVDDALHRLQAGAVTGRLVLQP